MWSIKQRRTKPRTVGNKVIYPKLNATAKPNRYVNRNTYLDVKCNKDKGAGCTIVGCQCSTDASGNTYCCKTAPYRNPILGYREHLVDCSATDLGCRLPINDVSGNVYKDNYAKSCGDPANSSVCYNPVIKKTQNRNGCVNESYNYSTNQYLTRRCLTFPQQEFNFQSQVPVDASGCCTKFRSCANCQYGSSSACRCSANGFCIGINKLPCEVKNTKCFAIYKRSNPKFNRQGAVSGGSRINRLKYQTRIVAQGRKVNGRNNVINRRGPAANYMTSRPLTMDAPGCWLNEGRTRNGLAQRCSVPQPRCPTIPIVIVNLVVNNFEATPGSSSSYITIQYNQTLGDVPNSGNFTVSNITQNNQSNISTIDIITTHILNDTIRIELTSSAISASDLMTLSYLSTHTPYITSLVGGQSSPNITQDIIAEGGISDSNFHNLIDIWLDGGTPKEALIVTNGEISAWEVSAVTNMRDAFSKSRNSKAATFGEQSNEDIGGWDTGNTTDMSGCFYMNRVFNYDISGWDTSSVINMRGMFANTIEFNQNLNDWDTSKVTNMSYMFYDTIEFNQKIEDWNTSSVLDMSYMFAYAEAFNKTIEDWNTSSVIDMKYMFYHTPKFNQSIKDWDVKKVADMKYMFFNASSFNQNLEQWLLISISDANSLEGCFLGAGVTGSWTSQVQGWHDRVFSQTPKIAPDFYSDAYNGWAPSMHSYPKLI
jgi:surface protein